MARYSIEELNDAKKDWEKYDEVEFIELDGKFVVNYKDISDRKFWWAETPSGRLDSLLFSKGSNKAEIQVHLMGEQGMVERQGVPQDWSRDVMGTGIIMLPGKTNTWEEVLEIVLDIENALLKGKPIPYKFSITKVWEE